MQNPASIALLNEFTANDNAPPGLQSPGFFSSVFSARRRSFGSRQVSLGHRQIGGSERLALRDGQLPTPD